MGRAERRRAERKNRIEARKDQVVMSRQEFGEIKETVRDDITKYNVDALLTCFALTERRLRGYGLTRITQSLEYIDELMGDILSGEKTIEDYKQELQDEIGLVIKS